MSINDVIQKHTEREKVLLQKYREILELQQRAIEEKNLDHIEASLVREREIQRELEALRTVRLPRRTAGGDREPAREELTLLYGDIRSRHQENRAKMADLAERTSREIQGLRIPPRRNTLYTSSRSTGSMVDFHS